MGRMTGSVGYDDVCSVLQRVSSEWSADNWFECRSELTRAPDNIDRSSLPADGQALLDAWILDDCPKARGSEYAKYFWTLDSWTEYWDIYRPETRGKYYFGDGDKIEGYLAAFLPTPQSTRNPVFDSWKTLAVCSEDVPSPVLLDRFYVEARRPQVVEAVRAVDELVLRLVREHFARAKENVDPLAYLDAIERFARNMLPECPERLALVPPNDMRRQSALHHTMEGDIMWFAWATHLECGQLVASEDPGAQALRRLLMAGVALGCSFDFAFRGGRRTRSEYTPAGPGAWERIWSRARECTLDFEFAANEVRQLFRIREFGDQ